VFLRYCQIVSAGKYFRENRKTVKLQFRFGGRQSICLFLARKNTDDKTRDTILCQYRRRAKIADVALLPPTPSQLCAFLLACQDILQDNISMKIEKQLGFAFRLGRQQNVRLFLAIKMKKLFIRSQADTNGA
jgi:hypothetical protein